MVCSKHTILTVSMASTGQDHELEPPKTEKGDGPPWSHEDLITSKLAREIIEYTFCGSWKALHAGKWDDFHKFRAKNVDSELLLLNDEELTRDWKEFQATSKDRFDSYQELKLPERLVPGEDPDLRDSALSDLQFAWKMRNQFHLEFLMNSSNQRTLWRIAAGDLNYGAEILSTANLLSDYKREGQYTNELAPSTWDRPQFKHRLRKLLVAGIQSHIRQGGLNDDMLVKWTQILTFGPLVGDYKRHYTQDSG